MKNLNFKWVNILQMLVRLFSGLFISGWIFQDAMVWFANVFANGNIEWARYLFALLQMAGQIVLTWFLVRLKITSAQEAQNENIIAMGPPITALVFPISHEFLGATVSLTGIVDLGQAYRWWEKLTWISKIWARDQKSQGSQITESRQTVRSVERPRYAETASEGSGESRKRKIFWPDTLQKMMVREFPENAGKAKPDNRIAGHHFVLLPENEAQEFLDLAIATINKKYPNVAGNYDGKVPVVLAPPK